MKKSFLTALFGAMASLPHILPLIGVGTIGHVGGGTVDQLLSGIGMLGLGFFAKDYNVTGGTRQQ